MNTFFFPRFLFIFSAFFPLPLWRTGATFAQLSWTDNSTNEGGFLIERRIESNVTFTTLATLSAGTQVRTDTISGPEGWYCYRVRAFNTAGSAAPTNEVCSLTDPGRLLQSGEDQTPPMLGASGGPPSGPGRPSEDEKQDLVLAAPTALIGTAHPQEAAYDLGGFEALAHQDPSLPTPPSDLIIE